MKKVLFITASLGCGGVEKTLITLINSIDKKKYSIDLLLMKKDGEFLSSVPKEVQVFEIITSKFLRYFILNYSVNIKNIVKKSVCSLKFYYLFLFLTIKTINKLSNLFIHKSFIHWYIKKKSNINHFNDYAVVCDYHGYGYFTTYLAASFSKDTKKFTWIHDENISKAYKYIKQCYKDFDAIFGVSNECIENFHNVFPDINDNKLKVLYNLIDVDEIKKKAMVGWSEKHEYLLNHFLIVSVGRLSKQKGFDLAIKVASLLKINDYVFKWIVVGDGIEKEYLSQKINDYNLQQDFILIGYDENPYKYIGKANLYVQTSRNEGFATTITEAVVLEKAIVTTQFAGITDQVINGENGFICNFDENDLFEKIKLVMDNSEIINKFQKKCVNSPLLKSNTLEVLNAFFDV